MMKDERPVDEPIAPDVDKDLFDRERDPHGSATQATALQQADGALSGVGQGDTLAVVVSHIFPPRSEAGIFRSPLCDMCKCFRLMGMSEQAIKVGTIMVLSLWSPYLGDKTPLVVRDPDGTTGRELFDLCLRFAPDGITRDELPKGKGRYFSPTLRAGCVTVLSDREDSLWDDPSYLHIDLQTDIEALKRRLIDKTRNSLSYDRDFLEVRHALIRNLFEIVIPGPVNVPFGEELVNRLDLGAQKLEVRFDALLGLLRNVTRINNGLREGPMAWVARKMGLRPDQLLKFLGRAASLPRDPAPLLCSRIDYHLFLRLANGVLANLRSLLTARQQAVFDVVRDENLKTIRQEFPDLPWPPNEKTMLDLLSQNVGFGANYTDIDTKIQQVRKQYPLAGSRDQNELEELRCMGFLKGTKVKSTIYYAVTRLYSDTHLRLPEIADMGDSAFGDAPPDPIAIRDIITGETVHV
jgi:hypothetical protein